MTLEGVRAAHRARPFRPFRIHTSSGESYPVRHPETLAMSPDVNVLVVMPGAGEVAMIDLDDVSELTFDLAAARAASDQQEIAAPSTIRGVSP